MRSKSVRQLVMIAVAVLLLGVFLIDSTRATSPPPAARPPPHYAANH